MDGAEVAVLKEVYRKVLCSLHSTNDITKEPGCG
jgi:hypothetical protein